MPSPPRAAVFATLLSLRLRFMLICRVAASAIIVCCCYFRHAADISHAIYAAADTMMLITPRYAMIRYACLLSMLPAFR